MASSPEKAQRKRFFVSRQIQGRLLGRLVLYWLVYHVVLWHAMFLYRYLQYRGELLAGARPLPFAELFGEFVLQHYSMLVCALAVLPLLIWDGIRVTHKVAGPLVRFRNALQALTRGEDVQPIRLRKGDMLTEYQQAFNDYLASLESRQQRSATSDTSDQPGLQLHDETGTDSEAEPAPAGGEPVLQPVR